MDKVIKFRKDRKFNKKKLALLIVIIVLIILVITSAVIYNSNKNFRDFMDKHIFRKDVTEENVPIIEIDYNSNTNIFTYGKYICVLAENTLNEYSSSGKKEKEVKIEINNPIYDVNGKYLVIAENNSQKIYLISDDHVIWEKNIDGNLNKVTVNKNGYVCAIVTGTTYKSVIITFDEKGNELFKSYLSNTIAVDAYVSPDNSEFAYAEVNNSGTVIQSNIKIISIKDVKEKNTEAKYTYNAPQDSLILRIKYQDKNQLICMYDDGIHKFESGVDVELVKLNEDNPKITFADIELDGHIFRTYEKSTGIFSADTVVEIQNTSNGKENVYTIEEVAKAVSSYNNVIAINLGDEVYFVDTNAWLIKRYTSSQVIEKIILGDGVAGIIYRDKIEIVNL
jgi:hypothetical protein